MSELLFQLSSNEPETQSLYEPERITLKKLGYISSHSLEENSILKVFKESVFEVEVIGMWINRNHAPTCTMYLTDDFRVRISTNCDLLTIQQIVHDIKENNHKFLRFFLKDCTSLENYCTSLLTGSCPSNIFVKNIDSCTIGSISIET